MTNEKRRVVLAVDYESTMLRLIKRALEPADFSVLTATNGDEAARLTKEHQPDLVISEVALPQKSGFELLREIRELSNARFVFLSNRVDDVDVVRGLELGADAYIRKPINLRLFVAEIKAVLKRTAAMPESRKIVRAGNVEIDLTRRLTTKNGQIVNLTRTEWNLLQLLASNAGKEMTNAELLRKVWGPEYVHDLQYLRVWISRLRTKLGDLSSKVIITLPDNGYMLVGSANAPTQ